MRVTMMAFYSPEVTDQSMGFHCLPNLQEARSAAVQVLKGIVTKHRPGSLKTSWTVNTFLDKRHHQLSCEVLIGY